jgi:hypothetical protein
MLNAVVYFQHQKQVRMKIGPKETGKSPNKSSRAFQLQAWSRCRSIVVSTSILSSPGGFPPFIEPMGYPREAIPLPMAWFPLLRNLIDPEFLEVVVSLVDAPRLATRRVMRSGAMT